MRRRIRKIARGTVRTWVGWFMVGLLLWAMQLIWLYHRLGRPTWSEYWRLRGVYRPGIQAAQQHGGDYLPGYFFNAFSPAGAKWAFIVASGVYAFAAVMTLWGLVLLWRMARRPRKAVGRRITRSLA